MRILIVSATSAEIAPVVARLNDGSTTGPRRTTHRHGAHVVDVLTTGVGMVATAAWCARTLSERSYDLALNLGLCGSFDAAFPPGALVHVTADRFAELGAEDRDAFLTMEELQLVGADEFPFRGGQLVNSRPPVNRSLNDLPSVCGITVNTVHGREASIAEVVARFRPQVESMEGAAFMYACLIQPIPFAAVRAVSNAVEPRNRGAWRVGEAVDALAGSALRILDAV